MSPSSEHFIVSGLSQHEFNCEFHTRCSKSTSAELDQLTLISRRMMFCDSQTSIQEILVDDVEQSDCDVENDEVNISWPSVWWACKTWHNSTVFNCHVDMKCSLTLFLWQLTASWKHLVAKFQLQSWQLDVDQMAFARTWSQQEFCENSRQCSEDFRVLTRDGSWGDLDCHCKPSI